jgi:hypothetical protein
MFCVLFNFLWYSCSCKHGSLSDNKDSQNTSCNPKVLIHFFYSMPDKSTLHILILLLKIKFNVIFPSTNRFVILCSLYVTYIPYDDVFVIWYLMPNTVLKKKSCFKYCAYEGGYFIYSKRVIQN